MKFEFLIRNRPRSPIVLLPDGSKSYRSPALISICLVLLFGNSCWLQEKRVLNSWQSTGTPFAVRITELEERRFPLSKFHYVFEAMPAGSDSWREIIIATTDDDLPIPRDQVRFIDDRTAHVFMADRYAVTTDGGHSWSTWKANDRINNVKFPDQFYIEEVLVNPDGSGTLVVTSRSADKQRLSFRTQDFGRNWAAN